MVNGRFRQRRVGALAEFLQACIGITQTQADEFLQTRRKIGHLAAFGQLADADDLVDRRFGAFRLVGEFGIHLAVDVVAHAFAHALVFHSKRALMRADERKEFRNGRAAFEIDDIRVATMQDARLDAAIVHQRHQAVGEAFVFDRDLEMEIAARLSDKAAPQECAAQIRRFAARLVDQVLVNAHFQAHVAQNAQVVQRLLDTRLRRHHDEVIRRFMQHAATHGKLCLQGVGLMERFDNQAGDRTDFRSDLEAVAPRARKEQRALDTDERRKRGLVAMAATRRDARELVFDIGGKRHGTLLS